MDARSELILGAAISVATALGCLALTTLVLTRLPPSYLVSDTAWPAWAGHPSWMRFFLRSAKNASGAILIVVGIIMAIPGVPGPGIITIAIGLLMIDLPGKRALERKILGRPSVLDNVNGLRRRFGKPPLEPPYRG